MFDHFTLQVMGKVMKTVPNRDSSHKHYLPSKFYPLNIFPKHLSGSGYVLSMSVVPILYECMLRTPFMNLEDVMLTGLCATTQMGLKLSDNALFRAKKPTIGPEYVCFYKKSAFVSIFLLYSQAHWCRGHTHRAHLTPEYLLSQISNLDFARNLNITYRNF